MAVLPPLMIHALLRLLTGRGRAVRTTIAGLHIDGGMLYVGKGLLALNRIGIEPALIDPSLPVDLRTPDYAGALMPYWPSYSSIPPASRGAYLRWLAGGRSDPGIGIGHVFLYFYGLERRALAEATENDATRKELPEIQAEVERLSEIYRTSAPFRRYAFAFLDVLRFATQDGPFYASAPPPAEEKGRELPLGIRAALGQLASEGKPLTNEWALAWYLHEPETRLRTTSIRCQSEITELFRRRYGDRFGEGLALQPAKRALSLTYYPASSSFGGQITSLPLRTASTREIPEVNPRPLSKIVELAEECVADLEPFSRWIGRNPDQRDSPGAIALLPREIRGSVRSPSVEALWAAARERLEESDSATMPAEDLWRTWPEPVDKIQRSEALLLLQLLEHQGVGVEPDVRFGGPNVPAEGNVVLFRLPPTAPSAASPATVAGRLLLHLAAVVAGADGELERSEVRQLESHIEEALFIAPEERPRHRAYLRWLLASKPSATGLKKRLESLESPQRESIGRFLADIANADGKVTPSEVAMLTRLYGLLQIDPARVYSDLHAGAVAEAAPDEPVSVRPAAGAKGFSISGPPRPPAPAQGVALSRDRIEAKLAQTAAVSALLSSIFVEDEPQPASTPPPEPDGSGTPGLDASHHSFLEALLARASWTRAEVEALAQRLGLMTDGALDVLNEHSLERSGEPLFEGEDPLEVNPEAAKEYVS